MASSAGHRNPKCHALNFFYDKHDGCALTILVNEIRFHIIADGNRLGPKSGAGSRLANEFRGLLRAVRYQDQDYTKTSSQEDLRSSPVDPGSLDSGHGASEDDEEEEEEEDSDHDSAVDLAENGAKTKQPQGVADSHDDPQKALNNWILQPFGEILDEKAPYSEPAKEQSVSQWYERPTFFYSLDQHNGKPKATEEEVTEDLQDRMRGIVPKLSMPKYIKNLNIPWYSAKDVVVLDTSDDPEPYHPSHVRVDGETYFFKVVDPTQPQPTKREIDIVKRIENKGLHEQMNVPLVKGLVGYENSHTEIIGFLQTQIEDPTPLTTMLDEDVPQQKRDRWAKKSGRIRDLLHENNIIWGDAKADNFMVDKHDKLWIIDFGGSYTEGWVDPELVESQEGDDMGVDKIMNALHDPIANTLDPNEDKTRYQHPSSTPATRKRKAEDEGDDAAENKDDSTDLADETTKPRKRVRIRESVEVDTRPDSDRQYRTDEQDEEDNDNQEDEQEQFCICNKPSSGDMIGCDNNDCPHQWFHFECVGLDKVPTKKHWYCEDCRS